MKLNSTIPPVHGYDASDSSVELAALPPDTTRFAHVFCRRAATTAAAIAILIGVLTLVGRATNLVVLTGHFSTFVPMANSTATIMILFGLALLLHVQMPTRRLCKVYAASCSAIIALWGLMDFAERRLPIRQFIILIEDLIFRTEETDATVNAMSPFTAIVCFLLGCALFLQVCFSGGKSRAIVGFLAFLAVFLNFWVLWEYVDDAAFGGIIWYICRIAEADYIPVAINTAVAGLVLGWGIIVAAGPQHFLVRPFFGSSTQAMLLRTFLPLNIVAVLIAGGLHSHRLDVLSNEFALLGTVSTISIAAILTLIISSIARVLGNKIDQAEREKEEALGETRLALAAQQASEGQLRAVMNAVDDGILTLNHDGIIKSFNQGAANIFGYRPEDVVGQSVKMLLAVADDAPPNLSGAVILNMRLEMAVGGPREIEGKHKNGTCVPLELAVGKVMVGDMNLFTASFHDLTNRKLAEMEICRARDAAEQANVAKSRFLATMSHELRSPLTAILGYTEILQEEVQEAGQQQMLSDLDKVHAQSKHLLTLINDVLDMAKIEAGKMDLCPETFELAKLIPDLTNIVQPLLTKHANHVEVHTSANLGMMHTDLTRLRQCLFNLLSNAAKFTEKGTITLTVTRETIGGEDWIKFEVKDTGIGMTNEQMQKVFLPFAQANSSITRKYGGTGLGLTITRKLCQLMGGDVSLASLPGEGSTFTIRLPAVVPKPGAWLLTQPAPVPESALPAPGQNTVLVVDDDPAVLDMLRRFLTKEGFQVVTAAKGEDCLSLARKIRPRAITLDVLMPGVDGWTILAALKADSELADIPVIILSIVEDKKMGFALGASDYLVKPLDRDRLREALMKRSSPSSPLALVAEDDPATREILRRHLEKDGWTVAEAMNGRQALDFVANTLPALILLDLMMPTMDGFEFLAELAKNPIWHRIPVIVITAKDLSEEDRMYLNASMLLSVGVKRVLQKGKFSRDELLQEVHNLVVNS